MKEREGERESEPIVYQMKEREKNFGKLKAMYKSQKWYSKWNNHKYDTYFCQ